MQTIQEKPGMQLADVLIIKGNIFEKETFIGLFFYEGP